MNRLIQSKEIFLGKKGIGANNPIYTIADLGLTNGGDLERTHKLIDISKEIGVDAVKFQMIGPDTLLGDKEVEYTYPTLNDGPKTENMYTMFKKLEYTQEQWIEIFEHCKRVELEFICTSHYMGALDLLDKIPMNIHKICTWSASHKRLIKKIGKTGLPLLLDTGVFNEDDFKEMLSWFQEGGGKDVVVLHDFHTKNYEEMNFLSIPYIKKNYNFPVGYTPQGRDYDLDFMAVGFGVDLLEKRLTIDRSIAQNGHHKALEPEEFRDWLSRIRNLEKAVGRTGIFPTEDDIEQSKKYFKSLWLTEDVQKGEEITSNIIMERRPGIGISGKHFDKVINKKAKKNIKKDTMLKWEDLE